MTLTKYHLALVLLSFTTQPAFADYDGLARKQAEQLAAKQYAKDYAEAMQSMNKENADFIRDMSNFVRVHNGIASGPQYRTVPRYVTYAGQSKFRIGNEIIKIEFSTRDFYECKAVFGNHYFQVGHVEINCINSRTGRYINNFSNQELSKIKSARESLE